MPDMFYTDRLYPFMDKVLSLLKAVDSPFYLTGGTALGRHYLHHRYSDDLDLFVNQAAKFYPRIDHWRNILSNKLCALSRREPKDMADILLIALSFPFLWQEIFSEARQKDLWVEPLEIARTIDEFPIDLLTAVKWEQPVDPDACTIALKILHSDIFHGRSNSLQDPKVSLKKRSDRYGKND